MTANLLVAVPAALGAAAGFGLAGALQHRAARVCPAASVLDPHLVPALVRSPVWLVGVGSVGIGSTLQLVALAYGPLALVQPLLVAGLPFAAVLSTMPSGTSTDARTLVGAVVCGGGLTGFLLLARPTEPVAGAVVDLGQVAVLGCSLCWPS